MSFYRKTFLACILVALSFHSHVFAKDTIQPASSSKLKFATEDGNYSFEVGGRLMIDFVYYDDELNDFASGAEIRRARVSFKGKIHNDFIYKAQYEFSGNATEVKDIWLGYNIIDTVLVKVGKFEQPNSLEGSTSSKNITFMERSLPVNAFSPGKTIGINLGASGNNWSATAGLFVDNDASEVEGTQDERPGYAARATFAPLNEKTHAIHVGLWGQYRAPVSNTYEIEVSPEADVNDVNLMDTGELFFIDNYTTMGIEAAWVYGPASAQGEYIATTVNRLGSFEAIEFNGYYASASYFITGESRPYKGSKGSFGKIKPKGKYGAWEVAIRTSFIDLDDENVSKGKEENLTLGLNWYANSNARVMFNFIKVDTDNDTRASDLNIYQLRTQLAF